VRDESQLDDACTTRSDDSCLRLSHRPRRRRFPCCEPTMAPPVALPPAAASEPATTPTTATPTPPPAALTPSDGDDGSTGGLPLAPRASWQVPEGSVWGPVPQGKKKSPVYAYFVSSDVHISPTNVSPTNTHEHNSMYHTMRLDEMMRDDATTLCGAVDGCLQQVKDQRGYSTWHQ